MRMEHWWHDPDVDKTEVFGEKPLPEALCPLYIRSSAVKG
jgi:hypothetical protein